MASLALVIAAATPLGGDYAGDVRTMGNVLELTRGQETELPQALKWQVARADEDYEAAQVEARRITVDTTRIASESFPMAVPPEEAERRCRRALLHLVAREELDLEVEQALARVGQHIGRRHVHRLRAARVGDERDRLVDGRVPPDRVDGEGRAKLLLLPLGHLDEHEADDLRLRREEWHELLVREPGVEVVKRHRL